MNRQFLVILVVLLVVIGGAALLVFRQGETAKPAVTSQLGQPLLKGLRASDVATITIREPKETLTLAKKDNRWTIAEKNGFAADLDKVTDLVVKSIELKAGQVEPVGEKDRARLSLAEPGKEGAATVVTFKAADGKVLGELLVGKKYFKKEPEGDKSKAQGDGRFVMLPSDPKQVYVVSDPLRVATAATGEWISKEGVAIEKVKTLEVKPADGGEGYRIERVTDGIDWKLDRATPTQKLDVSRANAASYSLNKLEIEDLAAPGADTGLDKPTTIVATTFDDLTYTVLVGKAEKDRTFIKVDVAGTPKRQPSPPGKDEKPEDKEKREKAAVEEVKKLEERVAREKTLKDYVLVVQTRKLADTLKKRSELLEQKKPEAATAKK
jgi:hypothetical protein